MFEPDILAKMKDCNYMVAMHGEGAIAQMVRGWDAVLLHIKQELDPNGDDGFELPEALFNPEHWYNDANDVPFAFGRHEIVDMVYLVIYRIHSNAPSEATKSYLLGYGVNGYWTAQACGGTTKFYDERNFLQFEVSGEFSEFTANQFLGVHIAALEAGQGIGKRALQKKLHELISVPAN